jgi:putative toxin-antitoxin system antitoxin component (TIGR02293 family)
MAEKSIRGESLSRALRFLGEKTDVSGATKTPARERKRGGYTVIEVKKVTGGKVSFRKSPKATSLNVKSKVILRPDAIDRLANKLDVADFVILDVSGISERTFHRRQQQGESLTPEETDRILRIARVAGEAERVFGDAEKSRRWLARDNAVLGAAPLSLLATDAGSRDVESELLRIDWGDFA